jgi:hypothetical protein
MRIILIAALFLLPMSAVGAMPLHNVVPGAMHHRHHPLTGKKLDNTAAVHHPVTGKKLHDTAKAGLDVHQMHKDANIHKMPHQRIHDKSVVFDRKN